MNKAIYHRVETKAPNLLQMEILPNFTSQRLRKRSVKTRARFYFVWKIGVLHWFGRSHLLVASSHLLSNWVYLRPTSCKFIANLNRKQVNERGWCFWMWWEMLWGCTWSQGCAPKLCFVESQTPKLHCIELIWKDMRHHGIMHQLLIKYAKIKKIFVRCSKNMW